MSFKQVIRNVSRTRWFFRIMRREFYARLTETVVCLVLVVLTCTPSPAQEEEQVFRLPPVDVTSPWPLTSPEFNKISKPAYPEPARQRGERGTVDLLLKVLSDGSVGDVSIKKSSGFRLLDEAALTEAKRWQFVPARRGPKAAEAWIEVPVRFELIE